MILENLVEEEWFGGPCCREAQQSCVRRLQNKLLRNLSTDAQFPYPWRQSFDVDFGEFFIAHVFIVNVCKWTVRDQIIRTKWMSDFGSGRFIQQAHFSGSKPVPGHTVSHGGEKSVEPQPKADNGGGLTLWLRGDNKFQNEWTLCSCFKNILVGYLCKLDKPRQ